MTSNKLGSEMKIRKMKNRYLKQTKTFLSLLGKNLLENNAVF